MSIELNYTTSEKAYINIHKDFLENHEKWIKDKKAFLNGDTLQVFDVHMNIDISSLDEDFDFFKHFAYTKHKWSSLISNYVNFNELSLVKGDVLSREAKSATNYNVMMRFSNKHGHGKACLMTLVFSRRPYSDIPRITATMRSSEMTKRLIFDLTLLDRIGKFVYGENQRFEVSIFATQMYLQGSLSFPMFDTIIPLKKFMKNIKGTIIYDRIMKSVKKFKNKNPDDIAYGSHKRNAWVLQGLNPHNRKPLYIKDCQLPYTKIVNLDK